MAPAAGSKDRTLLDRRLIAQSLVGKSGQQKCLQIRPLERRHKIVKKIAHRPFQSGMSLVHTPRTTGLALVAFSRLRTGWNDAFGVDLSSVCL